MIPRTFLPTLALCAMVSAGLPFTASAKQAKFRISLDTNATHVRNQGVQIFVDELEKRAGSELAIDVYPSAQLFRDRDVAKALRQGAIEMAVPGTWQLEGSVPDAAITALPMFYGVDPKITRQLIDGSLGEAINSKIEEKLRVKVPGQWADAGAIHFYSTSKPIESYEDFPGLKVQYSGGTTFAARIEGLGGNAIMIPFSDLPMAMSQGAVQAIASSREGVRTAKLWDSGLQHAFDDYQFMAQYVPMISQRFWSKQSDEVKQHIQEAWAIAVKRQRELVAEAEQSAAKEMTEHGIKTVTPSEADRTAARKQLMKTQAALVKELGIDEKAEALAKEKLNEADIDL